MESTPLAAFGFIGAAVVGTTALRRRCAAKPDEHGLGALDISSRAARSVKPFAPYIGPLRGRRSQRESVRLTRCGHRPAGLPARGVGSAP